jgi:hypothetical protein
LDYWNATYFYLLKFQYPNIKFLNHNALCATPVKSLLTVIATLAIDGDASLLARQITNAHAAADSDEFCTELVCRALVTHDALHSSNKNLL